jgi:uncharacterized protein (TIGR04255 family)
MTTKRAHYSNAPITEALIDLRITRAQDFSVDDLGKIGEAIADSYPSQEPIYLHSGQLSLRQPDDPMQIETTHQHGGFRLTSQNKQQILQVRIDGFTFSTLAPYDRWETFRDEARSMWNLYRSVTKPEGVTRAAVRYINHLDIASFTPDSSNVALENYLNVYPQYPDSWLPSNFFMQLQVWQEDLECWLVVNEAPTLSSGQEAASLQLDFDMFREQFEEPWRADDDAAVWDFLEQLHIRKNEIFEASITEETRRFIR